MRDAVWTTVRVAGAAAAVAAVVATRLRRVEGASMGPTLHDGDVIAVLPRWWGTLRVGDLVVVRDPRDPERQSVKRIVGLPGDWSDLGGLPAEVPTGHVAVAGDDPAASTDSRHYGAVRDALIVGRALNLRPTRGRGGSPLPRATASGGPGRT